MSRFIPIQWGSYGTTVWIPSQLEPAVALIGTSLPALRQMFSAGAKPPYRQGQHRVIDSVGVCDRKVTDVSISLLVKEEWQGRCHQYLTDPVHKT